MWYWCRVGEYSQSLSPLSLCHVRPKYSYSYYSREWSLKIMNDKSSTVSQPTPSITQDGVKTRRRDLSLGSQSGLYSCRRPGIEKRFLGFPNVLDSVLWWKLHSNHDCSRCWPALSWAEDQMQNRKMNINTYRVSAFISILPLVRNSSYTFF